MLDPTMPPDDAILERLFSPHLLLHPQRLDGVIKEACHYFPPSYQDKRDKIFDAFCDRWIRHRYRMSLPEAWPSQEASYLLGLNFDRLETLLLRAGLLLLYPKLLMMIDGTQLRSLTKSIGEDNDAFLWNKKHKWLSCMNMNFVSTNHTIALGRWFVINQLPDGVEGRNFVRLRTSSYYDTIPLKVPKSWKPPAETMTIHHLKTLINEEGMNEKQTGEEPRRQNPIETIKTS